MTTISAIIIADSVSHEGIRLTTMQLRYPRPIHGEVMTHRVFSRNASSSRAIPVKKIIEDIQRDPYIPIHWGANQPGMQAHEEISQPNQREAESIWLHARDGAILKVEDLLSLGLHKQVANRILEPWSHINVIVSSTEWDNFFELRDHPDAMPEIQRLAQVMKEAMDNSRRDLVMPGEWHLPYVKLTEDSASAYTLAKKNRITRDEPSKQEIFGILRKVSTARCARVSYLTHDGRNTTVEEDVALHDKLVVAKPLHASPAEHVATPDSLYANEGEWLNPENHGNFTGWQQYRKFLDM